MYSYSFSYNKLLSIKIYINHHLPVILVYCSSFSCHYFPRIPCLSLPSRTQPEDTGIIRKGIVLWRVGSMQEKQPLSEQAIKVNDKREKNTGCHLSLFRRLSTVISSQHMSGVSSDVISQDHQHQYVEYQKLVTELAQGKIRF